MVKMFSKRIKELRIQNQMPQRQLVAALDIDTATYCKIEKGERKAKREQVEIIANVLKTDKVCRLIKDEKNTTQILKIVQKTL